MITDQQADDPDEVPEPDEQPQLNPRELADMVRRRSDPFYTSESSGHGSHSEPAPDDPRGLAQQVPRRNTRSNLLPRRH